jgi:large-conductance mechanosensitive channel
MGAPADQVCCTSRFYWVAGPTCSTFDPGAAFKTIGDAFISIGLVFNALVSFLTVAFIMFLLVKAYNSPRAPEEEEREEDGWSEVDVRTEIRDQLRFNN